MPYDKALQTFFYKVSYKNPSPALPILPAVLSLILGIKNKTKLKCIINLKIALRKGCFRIFIIDKFYL